MKLIWSTQAWEDYLYWQSSDKSTLRKINDLIREIKRTPFIGKGKPEPLRYDLAGFWSRRITLEHRLVYGIEDDALLIVACRYHYQITRHMASEDCALYSVTNLSSEGAK